MVEKEIRENYASNITLRSLSEKYYVNSAYLGQLFRKKYGQSFKDYLNNYRMEQAAKLILESDAKDYVIARKVGYEDANYFNYVFKKAYGMSPSKYRTEHTAQ